MCPRKPRFSAGKRIFATGKGIFLQESAFFLWKMPSSVGKCIFLQEDASFCSLLRGVKNHEWKFVSGFLKVAFAKAAFDTLRERPDKHRAREPRKFDP